MNELEIRSATKHDKNFNIQDNHIEKYEKTSNGKWWLFQYFCMSYLERRRLNNSLLDIGHVKYEILTNNHNKKFN